MAKKNIITICSKNRGIRRTKLKRSRYQKWKKEKKKKNTYKRHEVGSKTIERFRNNDKTSAHTRASALFEVFFFSTKSIAVPTALEMALHFTSLACTLDFFDVLAFSSLSCPANTHSKTHKHIYQTHKFTHTNTPHYHINPHERTHTQTRTHKLNQTEIIDRTNHRE